MHTVETDTFIYTAQYTIVAKFVVSAEEKNRSIYS